MKLVILSDTHEQHEKVEIPDGDVLIHCGDWTNRGSPSAIEKFLVWLVSHHHKHIIFIPGNHELTLDPIQDEVNRLIKKYCKNHHLLINSSITIDGYKFYGSPITPQFFNWAFNKRRGKDIAAEWAKIPIDTNILITHGPPYGILDLVQNTNSGGDPHQGCEDLLKITKTLKQLKLHCFGHLHYNHGISEIDGTKYINASICDEDYDPVKKPVVIDI